jgi:hypothetical protein
MDETAWMRLEFQEYSRLLGNNNLDKLTWFPVVEKAPSWRRAPMIEMTMYSCSIWNLE